MIYSNFFTLNFFEEKKFKSKSKSKSYYFKVIFVKLGFIKSISSL